ncbi:sulfite exporter TauE/SafE family protein [Brevibacillus centrosporus]|uniref:cytochrome c biogenesis CcdA family protein n=1 Tax=Brevibacillus centrosporus TaxID=54910 RepID=UPI003985D0A2
MDWYSYLYQFGSWITKPFSDLYYGMGEQVPLIGALLLGMIGAFAPCQLSGNVAAFTVFGKKVISDGTFGSNLFMFILGKVLVYSTLGGIVFILGEQLSTQTIPLFQWARKLLAPLFLLIGLFMLGWIRLPFFQTQSFTRKMEQFTNRFEGRTQSFLLGFTFSLGFCPTMFWLFFGLAMPLMLSSSFGPFIPAVFALGTALPLAVVLLILAAVSDRPFILKKAREFGSVIQKAAGGIFIILGISDLFTFW